MKKICVAAAALIISAAGITAEAAPYIVTGIDSVCEHKCENGGKFGIYALYIKTGL